MVNKLNINNHNVIDFPKREIRKLRRSELELIAKKRYNLSLYEEPTQQSVTDKLWIHIQNEKQSLCINDTNIPPTTNIVENNANTSNNTYIKRFGDIDIEIFEDGMINLSAMDKLTTKRLRKFYESIEIKDYIKYLIEKYNNYSARIGADKIYNENDVLYKAKSKSYTAKGCWDIALEFARWMSFDIRDQFNSWIMDIFVNGKTDITQSSIEISNEIQEKLQDAQNQLENANNRALHAETKYQKMLTKQKYPKFTKQDCIYVVSNGVKNEYKIGKGGDINIILKDYRRLQPRTSIQLLFYTPDKEYLEKSLLKRFKQNLISLNHEVVENIEINDMVQIIKQFITDFSIEGNYEEDLDQYNNYIL